MKSLRLFIGKEVSLETMNLLEHFKVFWLDQFESLLERNWTIRYQSVPVFWCESMGLRAEDFSSYLATKRQVLK